MTTFDNTRIFSPLRVALKHSAIAVAAASWLAAGIALAAPPANDDFGNAINLTGVGAGQSGDPSAGTQTGTTTAESTFQVGEPVAQTFVGLPVNTVWFKWTSPADGQLTVFTNGSTNTTLPTPGEWDAILGIYSGAVVNALTPLGATPKDTGNQETMTVPVTAGSTYHIQLAGYDNGVAANLIVNWGFVATVYQADILSFGPGAAVGQVIDNAATITWALPGGTNPATLAPTFTLSPGATCTVGGLPVVSGTTVNLTNPVVFKVTAQGVSPIINNYTVTATVSTPILWKVAGDGFWDTITPNWLTQPGGVATTFANGKEAIFSNSAGGFITIDPDISPGFTTVNATEGTYVFEGEPLGGAGPLTKSGGGTLILSTANTYTGKTTVNGGTLEAVKNSSIGGSTSYSVADGATLLLSGTSGGGYKWPLAAAPLTGAGSVSIPLGSQLNVGLNFDMSAFTGTLNITSGQMTLNPFYSPSFVNPVNGTIRVAGPTTLYLGWQNTTFNTTVRLNGVNDNGENLGKLRGDTATLNGAVILESNSTIGAGGTFTINAVISDGGNGFGFTKVAGGAAIISGINTYKGPTVVNSGTLVCKNPSALGNGGPLSIVGTAKVNLDFVGNLNVSALTIAGAVKGPGVYGSSASPAPLANQNDVNFVGTGTGTVTVVVPNFADWAANNGVTGGVNGDSNNDGVQNGIAFFMNNTGLITNPGITGNTVTWPNGGNLPASEYGVTKQFVVQTSPDLAIWTPVAAGSLTTNTSGPGGSLSYTLPSGLGKHFVRLLVTPAP